MTRIRPDEVLAFAANSFPSYWAVELLCLLWTDRKRTWETRELVVAMRASEPVVSQSIDALASAGLIVSAGEGGTRYEAPEHLEDIVAGILMMHQTAPDKLRRAIVRANAPETSAFANAFRLRGDK